MKLYLDDIRTIPVGWFGVRSYKEFVEFIEKNGLPEFISFDHDLADEHYDDYFDNYLKPESEVKLKYDQYKEKTGYDCAKWLIEYCEKNNLELPLYQIHSFNSVGRFNIEQLLETYKTFKNYNNI